MFDEKFWYAKKEKKFIQNVDTFYYSIRLEESFVSYNADWRVLKVRDFCREYKENAIDGASYALGDYSLVYRFGSFGGFYTVRFENPEKWDFFIAPIVPDIDKDDDECSRTSEFVIQLRSRFLWEKGYYGAFMESFEFVKAFCEKFSLHIAEVKENRNDYAFHTNYLQNPEKFFRIDHFHKMALTSFNRVSMHYALRKDGYENDYIAMGKRGDKCFVRIYNKTKEVVQQGYKSWFLKLWYLEGMISRYDFYCYEKAVEQQNWEYVNVARLIFALENMDLSDMTVKHIKELIYTENGSYNYDAIRALAKELTPPTTIVLNIEFQVMRRMSKTFELIHYNDAPDPVCTRIIDLIDNRALITEYLTRKTLRLCVTDSLEKNKSRRDDIDFWKRLRTCKVVDMANNSHGLKMIRNYSSSLDLTLRKNRAANAISSVGYALKHDTESSVYEDAADVLALLNDNDMHKINMYKKRLSLRNKEDIPEDVKRMRCVQPHIWFIDPETDDIY